MLPPVTIYFSKSISLLEEKVQLIFLVIPMTLHFSEESPSCLSHLPILLITLLFLSPINLSHAIPQSLILPSLQLDAKNRPLLILIREEQEAQEGVHQRTQS